MAKIPSTTSCSIVNDFSQPTTAQSTSQVTSTGDPKPGMKLQTCHYNYVCTHVHVHLRNPIVLIIKPILKHPPFYVVRVCPQ